MRRFLTIIALSFALTVAGFAVSLAFTAAPVAADPITCPDSQVATKVDAWWTCVNAGGNANESEDSRNPNGNPNAKR